MGRLAIEGGDKSVQSSENEFVEQTKWPRIGSDELHAISKLFEDANISTHQIIRELEVAYCKNFNRKYALAHSNGTTALMASFWALDLNPGDKILVPTATFWASVLPMMWFGLVPVFCESEGTELGYDLDDMIQKWTPEVKAIVLVPLWGVPGKYNEVLKFAKEKDLRIIEDASHAHGAVFNEKPIGSFGDISVFSLQGDKLAPAGEGGILLTDDETIYQKAILMGDITRIIELPTNDRRFAATSFGVKSRIAPVSAAIGLESLKKLDKNNSIRKKNMELLSDALSTYGFECYKSNGKWKRTYFEFLARLPVKTEDNLLTIDEWIDALTAEGCKVSRPRYPLLHEQPFFTEGAFKKILRIEAVKCPNYLPGGFMKTRSLNQQMIKFPCFTDTNISVLNQYIEAIHKIGKAQTRIKSKAKK